MQEWFFYLVQCRDKSLYAGVTTDLNERLRKHNEGKGAKYTAGRRPVKVVYSEPCRSESAAKKREAQVKHWPRVKKEQLITGGKMVDSRAPGTWTIEGLFEGQPGSMKLFKVVRKYIESIGPVDVEATKTQVSFGVRTKFAWVWLPQTWIKKRPMNTITLAMDLDHEVKDPRIASAVEPRPGRWTHHVMIEKESDLDDKVKGWLREAYANGIVDRRRKAKK